MADSALATLLDQRERFLAFVRGRVQDNSFAEDILQSAYMRAMQHADQLRQEQSAVAWFYSVLRNAVTDYYRRQKTEVAAMDRWAFELGLKPDSEPVAMEPAAQTFICGCIEQVLPGLRPAYAEVLREVDLADAPLSEYAQKHKLTPGNAAVRAHRARAALRRELAKTCGSCSTHGCLDCTCKLPMQGRG